MKELASSILSGIIGGLTVWIIQQWYSNKREKRKEDHSLIASPSHSKIKVTSDILNGLKPGRGINLMLETLGQPAVRTKIDSGVFSDHSVETNSYLYFLNNAVVKITSKNNDMIDTLTVFPNDHSFRLAGIPNPLGLDIIVLNETIISSICNENFDHTVIATRHDEAFAIQQIVLNPINLVYTYFGYFGGNDFMGNWREYRKNRNPNVFLGGTLTGVCISNLDQDAYYAYSYEV